MRIEAIHDAIGGVRRQKHQMSSVRNRTGWEHFSHGSDIGVRGFGSSVEEAFEQAAVALTTVVADVSRIEESESVEVRR